jgi:hypothetical protein
MTKVTTDNNFCRVFQLPQKYPEGFCFDGGKPVTMKMVDWFQPIPVTDIINNDVKPWEVYVPQLRKFLGQKRYVLKDCKYLLLTDFDESMVFQLSQSGD